MAEAPLNYIANWGAAHGETWPSAGKCLVAEGHSGQEIKG